MMRKIVERCVQQRAPADLAAAAKLKGAKRGEPICPPSAGKLETRDIPACARPDFLIRVFSPIEYSEATGRPSRPTIELGLVPGLLCVVR